MFSSASANFGFPLLFSGQAQKEAFLNQAIVMIDALMSRSVVASYSEPPSNAVDGEAYLVTGPASGDWANMEDRIALRIAGAWQFTSPKTGMIIFDQLAGHLRVFRSTWEFAEEPLAPAGGNVIDVEARAAIASLISQLEGIGLFGED